MGKSTSTVQRYVHMQLDIKLFPESPLKSLRSLNCSSRKEVVLAHRAKRSVMQVWRISFKHRICCDPSELLTLCSTLTDQLNGYASYCAVVCCDSIKEEICVDLDDDGYVNQYCAAVSVGTHNFWYFVWCVTSQFTIQIAEGGCPCYEGQKKCNGALSNCKNHSSFSTEYWQSNCILQTHWTTDPATVHWYAATVPRRPARTMTRKGTCNNIAHR
jgi:hypothetical protein